MRAPRLALATALAASFLAAPAAQAVPEPRYVVEPCCDLCAQANNRAAYNTGYLESFAMLVQGRDGWLFRSDDLRTSFGPDEEGYGELKRLRDALKARGTDLVIVYLPPRALVHTDKLPKSARRTYNPELARFSYALTLQRFRKVGLVAPDLTQLLREPADPPYFFRGDHHWTPYGAQRTARIVADAVRQLPSYARLPKARFTTERVGLLAKKGSLYRAATQLCGAGYASQYVDRFATAREGDADLFGEAELPPVALVGTSMSEGDYNFAGFLSEHLGVDVLNASVPGGGHGAMLQYLPSPEFQKSPPKVLIWELQTNHNLSQRNFYRQVVPMVHDGCEARPALLSRRLNVRGQRNEVLFNGGGKLLPLTGRNHLVDLKFDDPAVREVDVTVWYTNGSKEAMHLRYPGHVETAGRFVFELRSDGEWGNRTFMSLDLRPGEGTPAGVGLSARLCTRPDGAGQQQAAAEPAPAPRGKAAHAR
jgi:alginate biosynthesis protein AlgX